MDVRCDRCGTEYEFDDALVSERGTSVKCTNCGHQFKVFRPRSGEAPEQWIVRAGDGREYVFASLRELQRAILGRQVKRSDRLARGGGVARALGAIPELSPFFDDADRGIGLPVNAPPPRARMDTPPGLGNPPSPSTLEPHGTTQGSIAVPLALASTVPAGNMGNGKPVTRTYGSPEISMKEIADRDPPTVPIRSEPRRTPAPPPVEPRPPSDSGDSEPATRRRSVPSEPEPFTPRPGEITYADEATAAYSRRRSGAARWIVAVVMLGTLGVLAVSVGRKWIDQATGAKSTAAASASSDARVGELLTAGERSLASGDLEAAKEAFLKASALAENDKRTLVDLARLEAMRADVPWLKLRVLPENAKEARAVAKAQLDEIAAQAKKAADRAFEVAPDDPTVARVKVDALRLLDDRSVARSLGPRLASSALQPETAYVLAALDLGEPSPPWTTVIERLRLASTAETSPGRARAALVYALFQSGDVVGAKSEFDRMASASTPYPVLPELRAMIEGAPKASASASASSAPARPSTVDVSALPAAGSTPPSGGVTGRSNDGDDVGEYSESDLQKKLFGDPPKGKATFEIPAGTRETPDKKPKPQPTVDTSDLPGVTPP